MKYSKSMWVYTIPSILSFLFIVLIPAISGFYYSMTSWNGIASDPQFVGLSNYINIIKNDTEFLSSFLFTAKLASLAVVLINFVGFSLALLVNQEFKGKNVFRSIFFMPNLIGGILLGFTWNFIFTSIFSGIGKATGWTFFEGWLSTTTTGFWGLLIVMTWQMSGYMMIIYIAQLQSIPDSVVEASKIDGATSFNRLINITIPLMWPAFTIGLFLTVSNSFKLFDQNLTLTAGGPNNSTQMVALNIYRTAFGRNLYGEAQAKAVIFLVVVSIISLIQLYLTKRKEVEM